MKNELPNIGEIVYDEEGKKYRFAEFVNTTKTYIVFPILILGGKEIDSTNHRVLQQVFEEPPLAALHKKVGILNKKEKDLTHHIDSKKEDLKKLDFEINKKAALLNSHPDLSLLDDFLNDRITHLVMRTYNKYTIVEFAEFMQTKEQYDNGKFKLLTLYGNENKDMSYVVSQYSDGSGTKCEITPCKSYDEAYGLIKQLFNKACLADMEAIRIPKSLCVLESRKFADFDFVIPREIREYYIADKRQSLINSQLRISAEMEKLNKELEYFTEG